MERVGRGRKSPGHDPVGGEILFRREFTKTVMAGADPIATPTDYFRVHVAVFEAGDPASGPTYVVDWDPAFLMESQQVAPLPATVRASDEAGPEALIVYTATCFLSSGTPAMPKPGCIGRSCPLMLRPDSSQRWWRLSASRPRTGASLGQKAGPVTVMGKIQSC